ncbi:MAG TPA: hypothetical protein VK047_00610, partial [Zeimonas sp.]|nr:hypothetical protein [Zeimonas sp.]
AYARRPVAASTRVGTREGRIADDRGCVRPANEDAMNVEHTSATRKRSSESTPRDVSVARRDVSRRRRIAPCVSAALKPPSSAAIAGEVGEHCSSSEAQGPKGRRDEGELRSRPRW